ncbi:MAG: cell division topological specificity factor MinE [Pseudomonadota bacterium]|nr:cell division topological specificity factor MinE [Pseudomonadota bacterium]
MFELKNLFGFNKSTASTAKKRLRLVLETSGDKRSKFVEQIRNEILTVIAKYANVSAEDIAVSVDQQSEGKSLLELSVNFNDEKVSPEEI